MIVLWGRKRTHMQKQTFKFITSFLLRRKSQLIAKYHHPWWTSWIQSTPSQLTWGTQCLQGWHWDGCKPKQQTTLTWSMVSNWGHGSVVRIGWYPLAIRHSYWTWPFIVDFPIKKNWWFSIANSYVSHYQRVAATGTWWKTSSATRWRSLILCRDVRDPSPSRHEGSHLHPGSNSSHTYLVGGLEHFLFSHILGIIIPTD